eukprot:746676-Hanusia_phi.AAC.5
MWEGRREKGREERREERRNEGNKGEDAPLTCSQESVSRPHLLGSSLHLRIQPLRTTRPRAQRGDRAAQRSPTSSRAAGSG